ncbi:MAG: potassium channel family protein [Oscillospiraceae bacterium]
MKSFLIIGMDTFGHHLCRELAGHKCEIMIADQREEALEDMLPYVISAKVGDCTNVEVLKTFDVPSFDACFVCMGSNFQNSLQITSLLRELGAKKVFGKADDDVHAKFLLRNGADHVIYPEREAAKTIAVSESSDSVFDCIPLTEDYFIYEISPLQKWIGKSIREMDIRAAHKINILALKRGDHVLPMPQADYVIRPDEHLLVMGHIDDISKLIHMK